jgi:uncharacterized membrane protein YccC
MRMDDEYVRYGVAQIFMEVEPLAGKRHVAVTERRTRKDWAQQIKQMLDQRYPDAIQVRLVMDNLNTHNIASLYASFEPQEAWRNGWTFITRPSTVAGSIWRRSNSAC